MSRVRHVGQQRARDSCMRPDRHIRGTRTQAVSGRDRGQNSYHCSCACVQPSNGRHTRRGGLLVDPVCRCLARRRSNPGLQDADGENDRRGHCARLRWRASHYCHTLGSFRLTIRYVQPIPGGFWVSQIGSVGYPSGTSQPQALALVSATSLISEGPLNSIHTIDRRAP